MLDLLAVPQVARGVRDGIACRPWLPWLLPVAFVPIWVCLLHAIEGVLVAHNPLPCDSPGLLVCLCMGMAVLTVPLYRMSRVPLGLLCSCLWYMLILLQQVTAFAFAYLHRAQAIIIGIGNLGLMIYIASELLLFLLFCRWSDTRRLRACIWTLCGGGGIAMVLVAEVLLCVLAAY